MANSFRFFTKSFEISQLIINFELEVRQTGQAFIFLQCFQPASCFKA